MFINNNTNNDQLEIYTVDSPLTDAAKSGHMPNNGQWSMYQQKIL